MGETADILVGWLWAGVAGYAAIGLLFSISFALSTAARLDESARTGSTGFRLIIIPAVILLWPLLAWKIRAANRGGVSPPDAEWPLRPETLRRIHGLAFMALLFTLPVLGTIAWFAAARQPAPGIVNLR